MNRDALVFDSKDNTATALRPLKSGETIFGVVLKCDIPVFHKFATHTILCHNKVYKYGEVIGLATQDIFPGDYIHIHNLVSARKKTNEDKP